jgi:hypothetical protein
MSVEPKNNTEKEFWIMTEVETTCRHAVTSLRSNQAFN